ncbi:18609_t:CDS:2, partial [Rhizophagus irregularis]
VMLYGVQSDDLFESGTLLTFLVAFFFFQQRFLTFWKLIDVIDVPFAVFSLVISSLDFLETNVTDTWNLIIFGD